MKHLKLLSTPAAVLVRMIITRAVPTEKVCCFVLWSLFYLDIVELDRCECVSSKLNIWFYFINYTSPILSTKLKMTTEWMMVFLSREPSQKPVLSKQRSQLSRLTPPVFSPESLAHTRELWKKEFQGWLKAWGDDTAEGPRLCHLSLKASFQKQTWRFKGVTS